MRVCVFFVEDMTVFMFVCVCVYVRACVRACVCVHARARVYHNGYMAAERSMSTFMKLM